MVSSVWDLAQDVKDTYINLFEATNNPEKYTKEQLLDIMKSESKTLKSSYQNLSSEYGWDR